MKLSAKYNRVNLATIVIVMLITGIVYYWVISLILVNKIDKDLVVEENEAFNYVKLNHALPQVFQSDDQQISFTPAAPGSVEREFIDTKYYKHKEGESAQKKKTESGRGLISSITADGKYYKLLIVESKVETEDLIQIIFGITIGVILLLLIVLYLTNRLILNRLWQPFYDLLKELRSFNIADNKEISPLKTDIDEFNELNEAVSAMSARVKHDYKDLKTFTENASHELLTPIAVINSKLDTLIQTENFNPQQGKLLNDLYTSVSKLTRLNQSLLLLVKIENGLLNDARPVNLKKVIEELLIQFDEILQDKQLTLTSKLEDKEIAANPYLVDILLNNLLSNAIRHNYRGGGIIIVLNNEQLIVKNTGENTRLENEQIFRRFHKSSNSEGSGLGLTISTQICESFNFRLNYAFDTPYHTFTVEFT